ncbi:FAD-dependent pyridine nucleotide-disulphide oxidoreductase [Beutenbergia cavernae DSM 12333]|uniref:FAD-dependent pyridine nucleotide-disulphide oxidoreductase n=1 Tax=Beutenbergia cavernae (strain ATCC BAA-8 / DSM 12333 / CCUG 43141 / JCM 11478 / NBRC 16432 / NCIMB 13614 / HKI 0122) TaxID=471853 RepID=C5BXL1_BEUC1|nr:FAD-dependent oxidoreductase [Beutenbergia cavernae]ACQ80894.1 FAD-dependent pyridine nucleotide-disulphide oxidoreductase [Beutenbergia cavernae DSM 12333]
MHSYTYLLIGGGMAADAAARGIRDLDGEVSIGIVGAEPTAPVQRPYLTKKLWLDSGTPFDDVWLRTAEDTGAVLRLGERVVELDTAAHVARTDVGEEYRYDRALLATSGTPRRIGLPEHDRVIPFRTVRDYQRLRELAGNGRHVAVVGGGFIGTELAAALAQNDTRVTMVFPEALVGAATYPAPLAAHLDAAFGGAGVEVRGGTTLASGRVRDDGSGVVLTTSDGDAIEADAVVLGLGIEIDLSLAEAAGLRTERGGVVVDSFLRSSDRDVFAAGDVARYPDKILGRTRVEHVEAAQTMGRQAGRNLAGAAEEYTFTPSFYSDLFADGFEAVGRLDARLGTVEDWRTPPGGDGQPEGVVYYLEGDRVVGVLLWNTWDSTDKARAVLARGRVDPAELPGTI